MHTILSPFDRGGRILDGYYLVVSALVPYKRIDLAVSVWGRESGICVNKA